MFFVYLLQSLQDGSFYIGQTNNKVSRINRHNSGHVPSTKSKAPWKMIGYEEYQTREEARWREYCLKNDSSEKKKFITNLTHPGNS
jgi:putative endonuclease